MDLFVKKYDEDENYHVCVGDGKTYRVDLMVDGALGNVSPESLVGKTVTADYLFPYVQIAMNPRIKDGENNASKGATDDAK